VPLGDARRGTGILNNERYIGRINWGRSQWKRGAADSSKRTVSLVADHARWVIYDEPRCGSSRRNFGIASKHARTAVLESPSRRHAGDRSSQLGGVVGLPRLWVTCCIRALPFAQHVRLHMRGAVHEAPDGVSARSARIALSSSLTPNCATAHRALAYQRNPPLRCRRRLAVALHQARAAERLIHFTKWTSGLRREPRNSGEETWPRRDSRG